MTNASSLFQKICIIGLGLIGSSIARAAKEFSAAESIIAYDASADVRQKVTDLRIADHVSDDLQNAVQDADCVILCAPVGTFADIMNKMIDFLKPGCVLTDVGSVKNKIITDMMPALGKRSDITFIPAHPLAGTEHSGPEAGFASLFENRWCILTPINEHDIQTTEFKKLKLFWERLGSKVDCLSPERHDLVLAITSHLPHLIAYNLVGTAAHLEQVSESDVIKYSASGFRDSTRLAASDPTMWRDIFLNNKEAVIEMLGRFTEDLIDLQRAIRYGDGEKLFNLFTETRKVRKEIIEAGQDTGKPNFGRDK